MGREVPFANIKELQKQLPILKKQYIYASDFAKAEMDEIFGSEKLRASDKYEVDNFYSRLYLNDGDGNFSLKELPHEIQYTSYTSGIGFDVDGDGKLELIPGGNYFDCNVQMGRYDADNGSVLSMDANGDFQLTPLSKNHLEGQVKNLRTITIGGKKYVIAAQNNDHLKILSFE